MQDGAWYATQTLQHGWSRTTLAVHIKNRLHLRQGAAVTNFEARLPAPASALALETLKDPYLFDFLGLGDDAQERDLPDALEQSLSSIADIEAELAGDLETFQAPNEPNFRQ